MSTLDGKRILVTGAAGFIGAHLCRGLLGGTSAHVVGLDNLNGYYDVALKEERLAMLAGADGDERFRFVRGDIADADSLADVFAEHRPDIVVNLAAQAGVRYSIDNPRAFVESNVVGFLNVLEACRASLGGDHPVGHLVYASSSSVYGSGCEAPFSEDARTDSPVSLYAATKKSDELMAHAYARLYGLPATGLRFFTVYGPAGRPDMAYYKFAERMRYGEPIELYNGGEMLRDFTYIDDVVEGIALVMARPPEPDAAGVRHRAYNIGASMPVKLTDFVDTLERVFIEEGAVEAPADRRLLPMQPGDVRQTHADVSALSRDFGWAPSTSLEEGLRAFARWFAARPPRHGVAG